jgi:hypothetical protein
MQALRPEIVVAGERAVHELRGRLPADRDGRAIPLLPVTPELADPEALIEAVREVLREANLERLRRTPAVVHAFRPASE